LPKPLANRKRTVLASFKPDLCQIPGPGPVIQHPRHLSQQHSAISIRQADPVRGKQFTAAPGRFAGTTKDTPQEDPGSKEG